MGMSKHDAYYEPEDYDDRTDEIEERAWELMKVGGMYDYKTAGSLAESLSEMSVNDAQSLQDVIDSGNYEALGRKLISMSCDYMEKYALSTAEQEICD